MAKKIKVRFSRQARLNPAQVRVVAGQRLDDAACLRNTGLSRHANGVVYLCGLVLDCLLKARLLDKHPHLRIADPSLLALPDRRVWDLIYRLHDLDGMLARLPEIERELAASDARGSNRLVISLKRVCAEWTIHSRYNVKPANLRDVHELFEDVKELRPWLE